MLVAAAKRSQKCLGRCGASSEHITKLEQSIFFRYLCKERQSIYFMSVGPNQIFIFKQLTHTLWLDSPSIIKVMLCDGSSTSNSPTSFGIFSIFHCQLRLDSNPGT
jgi:hypothetical protein